MSPTRQAVVADECMARAAPESLCFKLKRKDAGHDVRA